MGVSEIHGGLGIHGGPRKSSAGRPAVVTIVVTLGDLVPMNPLRAVLLRNAYLDAVLVDALDGSAVALEGTATDGDGLAHL